jgi:molecular chaperone GrpE
MTEPKSDEAENIDGEEISQSKEEPKPQEIKAPKIVTITDVELEQLKKEASEFKDKYLRLLAESENARKRLYKERQELTQFAVQNLIVDFLNPIDHMENALNYTQNMSDEVKHWALGFQMILGQFKDVLSNHNVQAFVSKGQQFDPHLHEAVEMLETDEYPSGTVVEESMRGYKMGDRIIRPSRVKVAKTPSEPVIINNETPVQDEEQND